MQIGSDLENASKYTSIFGLGIKDGLYTPSEKIDDETELWKSELSNPRVKTQLGALPMPTMPAKYMQNSYGDSNAENELRIGVSTYDGKPCNPKETSLQDRTFQIFTDDSPLPKPILSVEDYTRSGVASRVTFKNANIRPKYKI